MIDESSNRNADRIARLAERRDTSAERVRIDRAFRGAPVGTVCNPTFGLFVLTVLLVSAAAFSYAIDVTNMVVIPTMSVAIYVAFTVFHESCHGIAHRNTRINALLGWFGASFFPLPYPLFRSCHLRHHAHTNDPVLDPDFLVANKPRALMPLWFVGVVVSYRTRYYRFRWWSGRRELVQTLVVETLLISAILSSIRFGWWPALVALWVAPMVIAVLLLAFSFDFLPHAPHTSTSRYTDTRIVPGRFLNTVLLGQNYHLIHHLWTSIPWYRYRRAYATVSQELATQGAPIEGFWPGSTARQVVR